MDAAWRGVEGSSTKQPRLYEAFMSHAPQPRPSRASTLSIKAHVAKSSVLAEKAYQHEKARKEQAKRAHGAVAGYRKTKSKVFDFRLMR